MKGSPYKNGKPNKLKQILPFTGKGPGAMAKSTLFGAGLGLLGSKIFPKAFTPASGIIVGGALGAQTDFMRQSDWLNVKSKSKRRKRKKKI